jgi:hypothetical protein
MLRSRLPLALTLGLALSTAGARAQAPAVDPAVVQARCESCAGGAPNPMYRDAGPDEKPRTHRKWNIFQRWVNSNPTCENCGTLRLELDFIFGSCGDFNCGEVKRDLANRVPLAAYYGIVPSPYPSVRPPYRPDALPRIIPIERHGSSSVLPEAPPSAIIESQSFQGVPVNDLRR